MLCGSGSLAQVCCATNAHLLVKVYPAAKRGSTLNHFEVVNAGCLIKVVHVFKQDMLSLCCRWVAWQCAVRTNCRDTPLCHQQVLPFYLAHMKTTEVCYNPSLTAKVSSTPTTDFKQRVLPTRRCCPFSFGDHDNAGA